MSFVNKTHIVTLLIGMLGYSISSSAFLLNNYSNNASQYNNDYKFDCFLKTKVWKGNLSIYFGE